MPRKYNLNEKFFDTWSDEMAYVLGWIASDGCVRKNKRGSCLVKIKLNKKDVDILYNIRSFIQSEQPIYEYEKDQCVLQINSKKIYNSLICLGIVERKAKILKFPNIPIKYISHFIRGYFEGDGCITFFNKKSRGYGLPSISIYGNREFLDVIKKLFSDVYGKHIGFFPKPHTCDSYRLTGRICVSKFCEWIYKDSNNNTRLARKYNRYINYIRSEDADRK